MDLVVLSKVVDTFGIKSTKELIEQLTIDKIGFYIPWYKQLSEYNIFEKVTDIVGNSHALHCSCINEFDPECPTNLFDAIFYEAEFQNSTLLEQVEHINKFFNKFKVNLKSHLFENDDKYLLILDTPEHINTLIEIWKVEE